MRDIKTLQGFWRAHADEPLMLGTIVAKSGSGYRAVGAKKIITREGVCAGFLSGGCLEGEIVRQARARWDEAPFTASFSTMSDEDRLMGYQTGCAGIIDVLFERLPDMARMTEYLPYGPACGIAAVSVGMNGAGRAVHTAMPAARDGLFVDPWVEPFHLTVIGAGPNALPFADFTAGLGWDLTFLDYRAGNILPERADVRSLNAPVGALAGMVPEGSRSAVILATHNYEADMAIMAGLVGRHFRYVGCIGTRRRFEQMRDDLMTLQGVSMGDAWAEQVHAPAGLHQGHTPEDIAFSIVAEIQFGQPR